LAREIARVCRLCPSEIAHSARCRAIPPPDHRTVRVRFPPPPQFPPLFRLVAGSGGASCIQPWPVIQDGNPFRFTGGGKFIDECEPFPVIRFLFLGVLVLAPTLWAQKRSANLRTNRQDLWSRFVRPDFRKRIRYTFNADFERVQALSSVGLGAPRPTQVSYREGQGGQAGEVTVPALSTRQPRSLW